MSDPVVENRFSFFKRFIFLGVLFALTSCGLAEITKNVDTDTNPDPDPTPQFKIVTRNLEIDTLSERVIPTVKVVLVVDNSNSMQDEQAILADGFEQMFEQLKSKELNLDFYLYTTSSKDSDDAELKSSASYEVFYECTAPDGSLIANEECLDLEYPTTVTRKLNLASALGESPYRISSQMTASEIESVSGRIQNEIVNLGITGDDDEQAFCSLARSLFETDSEKSIFEEGDSAAFIFLSDSNDDSSLENCYKDSFENFDFYDGSSWSHYNYSWTDFIELAWRRYQRVRFETIDLVDIQYRVDMIVEEEVDGQIREVEKFNVSDRFNRAPISWHDGEVNTAYVACSAQDVNYLTTYRPAFIGAIEITDCEYRFRRKVKNYYLMLSESFQEFWEENWCEQSFEWNAQSYDNLYDWALENNSAELVGYQALDCLSRLQKRELKFGLQSEGVLPFKDYADLELGVGTSHLREAIRLKSEQLFGNGFIFSGIVAPDEADTGGCDPEDIEEFGKDYVEFSQALVDLGYLSSIHPICSSDYYPALEQVEDFIEDVTERSYEVPIEEAETLTQVYRVGLDGTEQELSVDIDFSVLGSTLRFNSGVLQVGDRILLTLSREVEAD